MATDLNLRTSVYVDAFNLYFGALKGTPHRWLNIETLCKLYLPNNNINSIKYFTAKVAARPNNLQQPVRQEAYLRALETIPCVEIIYGHYLSHVVTARLANPIKGKNPFVQIIKTEEKGSDVNLASHLLHDAHMNRFDIAVVISNDSDLLEPIKLVRKNLNKQVGLLNPQEKPSRELFRNADFFKPIRSGALAASQFPVSLIDKKRNEVHKPKDW